jgi:hypothetical protein
MTVPGDASNSAARRALAAYARRSPATQADIDYVMRSLVEHEDWYVPVLFADRAWGQSNFDQMLMFAEAVPSPVLTVFTDHESALRAEGQALGVFGGPVSGIKLMRALGSGYNALIVNPASPREHQWYIASGGFRIASDWAGAIVVERMLAERGNGPVPSAELMDHRFHLLIEKQAHAVAQVPLPEVDGVVAVCFTAADRAAEFFASLPAEVRGQADIAPIDGPQLFDMLRGIGTAGLVINAGSDDQTALSREDLTELAGLTSGAA